MFQDFKRSNYILRNNFSHCNTISAANMYNWLMKNHWPADRFVDLFMRVYPKTDIYSMKIFEHYLTDQFDWVHDDNIEALKSLYKNLCVSEFKKSEKDNLSSWVKIMYDGLDKRK
ncbi:MAG: hypothetical protein KGN31_07635 [Betaproteobacteria bacterium]|nr:hypothetical protein [Betaproteobacteria bacterium]